MARRMKANDAPGFWSPGNTHTVEHDEDSRCSVDPTCQPVEDIPMTSLTDAVNALYCWGSENALLSKAAVLNLVKDKVAVPSIGTFVVSGGVVHEADNWGRTSVGTNGYVNWNINVKTPEPTFFEVGKTYVTKTGVKFRVTAVEQDDFGAVAIGVTKWVNGDEQWSVRRQLVDWKEVE